MAALVPPPNGAGVPLPPNPANPPSLVDITNAKEYVDRLSFSKVAGHPNAATDGEIGASEAYKTAVVSAHSPDAHAAPPWLANLNATVQQIGANVAVLGAAVQQIRDDIAFLRLKSEEMPILLANSQAGTRGPLFNPTAMANGWAPYLIPPNPRTQNELMTFKTAQCIASAASLGLGALPAGSTITEQRRQIANRIGVTIE